MTWIKKTVIAPKIFSGYPEIRSGMSTKLGRKSQAGFEMNLSYKVGDDPATVEINRATFFSQFEIYNSELGRFHFNFIPPNVCR